jgi:DNA-binding transcriptional MerR regulator
VSETQPAVEDEGISVEELSARTGVTVRTIREYQTWQVLHPPTRVGRRGFYDDTHVRRLEGIARLQERGYSIAAIRDLFSAWEQGSGLRDVLGVDDAIGLPADEAPVWLDAGRLADLLPGIAGSARLSTRAVRMGLVQRAGDDFIARSPALVELVAAMIAVGRSPADALDMAEVILDSADRIGREVADAVAASLDVGLAEAEPLLRRGRVLLARAVATHSIERTGRYLAERAEHTPELARLLADVSIGTIANAPPDRARPGREATAR